MVSSAGSDFTSSAFVSSVFGCSFLGSCFFSASILDFSILGAAASSFLETSFETFSSFGLGASLAFSAVGFSSFLAFLPP